MKISVTGQEQGYLLIQVTV